MLIYEGTTLKTLKVIVNYVDICGATCSKISNVQMFLAIIKFKSNNKDQLFI